MVTKRRRRLGFCPWRYLIRFRRPRPFALQSGRRGRATPRPRRRRRWLKFNRFRAGCGRRARSGRRRRFLRAPASPCSTRSCAAARMAANPLSPVACASAWRSAPPQAARRCRGCARTRAPYETPSISRAVARPARQGGCIGCFGFMRRSPHASRRRSFAQLNFSG
jgi:hypothetical protein